MFDLFMSVKYVSFLFNCNMKECKNKCLSYYSVN